MRVPLSWLKDFVDIPVSPEELADRLTLAGLEVASIDYVGTTAPELSPWAPELDKPVPPDHIPWDPERVLVGELLEVQQHPNADRLTVPLVGYGDGRSVAVVTGAPNVRPGMSGRRVALALNGARLIDGHSDTRRWLTLKPAKLRGVASEGMLCSELELGLSGEHEGIMFLPDDAPVGMSLREYLGDVVLDIDLTPNLSRALSIVGVAREVAAILGVPLRLPDPVLVAEGPSIEGRARVSVESAEDCPRFTLGLIEGVTVGDSPWWMQHRLRMAGMRPIANIVDVSNYVMLEWGQPTHTFDADLVVDRHLIVRRARPGETLRTLDGQDRALGPEHIVVADPSGPEGLAGVMGGAETEVGEATRNVLLEAAIWNTTAVRKTAQHFRLPSEASYRYQRGVDYELPPIAQRRALELIREIAGGSVASGLVDVYGRTWQPLRLELSEAEVRRLLGIELAAPRIAELLESLGFGCRVDGERVQVEVPSFRLDVSGTADLVEEVARIHGYDKIPTTRIDDELPPPFTDQAQLDAAFVRDVLVACGLQEAITYTMTGPQTVELYDGTAPDIGRYVQVENPNAPERSLLRRELLPELSLALAADLRERPRVALFELGHVFEPRPGEALPAEPRHLALAMAGQSAPLSWRNPSPSPIDFWDGKGVLETLLERLRADGTGWEAAEDERLHPGRSALLRGPDGRELGVLGELHPQTRERLGLSGRAVVAEFDLDALLTLRRSAQYHSIYRQPAVYQDVAVIAPLGVPAEQAQRVIRETAGQLLESVELFDVYTGAPIPEGRRSMAFRMRFRAPDRTLTDADINKVRERIARRLEKELGATTRT